MMDTLQHDYSDVTRLDDHFAERRAQELKLEAEAQQGQMDVQMAPLRNERIRRMGLAALLSGAGIGLACFGASYMIAPKERVVTVQGPERVITRDVPGPERVVKVPEYVTPKEHDFVTRPEYESAEYKGRLVADADGLIRFDTGKVFVPQKLNPATGLLEDDSGAMYNTTPYLGDLAYCNAIPNSETKTANRRPQFNCLAIHNDVVIDLSTTHKQKGASAIAKP
jgi:hypothetical protein